MRNAVNGRFAAICFVFLSLFATSAFAQATPPASPRPAARRAPLARLLASPFRPVIMELRGVKLTPPQRQQIVGIVRAHQPEMKAVGEKLRAARLQWQQAGKIDIQQRRALNQQRLAVLENVRSEVFAVLTPEQQQQIQARRQKGGRRFE